MKILLVDDEKKFVMMLAKRLVLRGIEVDYAFTGDEALAKAKNNLYDVAVLDVKMPGINGVESFVKMKAHNPDVQVILVTAYTLDDLISQAQAEGILAILPKPLDMHKLLKTITAVLEKNSGGCILLADDDPAFCSSGVFRQA